MITTVMGAISNLHTIIKNAVVENGVFLYFFTMPLKGLILSVFFE
jgi:hypothetical protein